MSSPNRATLSPDLFEDVRVSSLRVFAVRRPDGSIDRVVAHQHDAGDNAAGCLSFVTIQPSGRQVISRVFNACAWEDVLEVTPADQQARLDAVESRQQFAQMRPVKGRH